MYIPFISGLNSASNHQIPATHHLVHVRIQWGCRVHFDGNLFVHFGALSAEYSLDKRIAR